MLLAQINQVADDFYLDVVDDTQQQAVRVVRYLPIPYILIVLFNTLFTCRIKK